MHDDVVVSGGSYAGMAAALQLVRARRSVPVIDAGERRNRFASHSHGFPGQDGTPPGEIAANARRQLDEAVDVMAGAQTHRSLLWPETVQPLQEEAAAP